MIAIGIVLGAYLLGVLAGNAPKVTPIEVVAVLATLAGLYAIRRNHGRRD